MPTASLTGDFDKLLAVYVKFQPHPIIKDANNYFDATYGDELPELDRLFTSTNRVEFTEGICDEIRNQIVQRLILPVASAHTQDDEHVARIIAA